MDIKIRRTAADKDRTMKGKPLKKAIDTRKRKEGGICVRVADAARARNAENPSKTANAADAERKRTSVHVRNKSIWFW